MSGAANLAATKVAIATAEAAAATDNCFQCCGQLALVLYFFLHFFLSHTHTHTLAGHVLVSLSVCLHVLLSVTHTHSIHFKCHTPFAARLQSDLLGSRCVWAMSFSTHFRRGLTGVCVLVCVCMCESCLVKGCTLAVKFSSTSSCRNFTTFALSLAFLLPPLSSLRSFLFPILHFKPYKVVAHTHAQREGRVTVSICSLGQAAYQ